MITDTSTIIITIIKILAIQVGRYMKILRERVPNSRIFLYSILEEPPLEGLPT
jgi:hypothetical protein